MTAHSATIQQLLLAERELEPTFEPHAPVDRVRLAMLAIVVLVTVLVALGHANVAAAARAVCTIGEPASSTCGDALVRIGYP
ncbi:MAG: hypothetical protein H7287_04060 [Thermoleophilia bacterium]|nr:hypothetical protein [Thermoleophilia bacterium]